MTIIKNQRGIALVLVMVLALIGLAIVSALLYMGTMGTRLSGGEKFYRTSDEAAFGGARIATDLIINNLDSAVAGGALSAPISALGTALGNNACLKQKLSLAPGAGFTNWTQCNTNMRNIDPADNPDMTFQLPGTQNLAYNVSAKIVDTIEGNTAGVATGGATGGGAAGSSTASGGLSTGGVGGGGASIVTPARRSWIYRIEVQAQGVDPANPAVTQPQRARYAVLYAH